MQAVKGVEIGFCAEGASSGRLRTTIGWRAGTTRAATNRAGGLKRNHQRSGCGSQAGLLKPISTLRRPLDRWTW
jgi:chorismate synthase